jgi:hypothetical protein
MGGGGTETTTQTSGPTNPMVDSTTTKLLTGLQDRYDSSTSMGSSAATKGGWASQLAAAGNPDYARGVNGAMTDFADAAAGYQAGANDPYYAKLSDNTMRDVGAMFTNSGRFGSGSHVEKAVETLGDVNNANIAADRQWQTTAASALPSMFAAGQAPGSVQTSVGQQQEAAPWANLSNASSILAGTAGVGTQQQTQTSPTAPWWQQALGAGAIGSGIYKNVWGS